MQSPDDLAQETPQEHQDRLARLVAEAVAADPTILTPEKVAAPPPFEAVHVIARNRRVIGPEVVDAQEG